VALGTQITYRLLHTINTTYIIFYFQFFSFYSGVYNGAKGTVIGFAFTGPVPLDPHPPHSTFHTMPLREIPTVFVRMDRPIGYSISKVDSNDNGDIVPFVAVCKSDDKYCTHYHRWQLPLEPAFACTTHKMQGTTATYGAVIEPSKGKPFSRGIDYVAASRPTILQNLFLLSPLTDRHFNAWPEERAEVRKEYARLALLFPSAKYTFNPNNARSS
jgi:hypothetical protein